MWPIVILGIGVLWYLREQKKPTVAAPPAASPSAERDAEWMKVLEGMAPQDQGAPPDQGAGGSGGSGGSGGGGYADGGEQVSVTSPVNPPTPAASATPPPAPVGQRVTVSTAQAKLDTTSATQMASRLQAPIGSIAKRRVL